MRECLLVLVAMSCGFVFSVAHARSPQELTIERVVQRPAPGMTIPRRIAFSPDGNWVTYLKGQKGSLVQDLWAVDLNTGESKVLIGPDALGGGVREGALSKEEELRRERQRELGQGVTDYRWASQANRMIIPSNGDLYLFEEGRLLRLTQTDEPEIDPHLSPDGGRVAFVRAGGLHVLTIQEGAKKHKTRRVSPPPGDGWSFGVAEFIAQEELGRSRGFWWSPDNRHLAFTAVDESGVTSFPIIHQGRVAWGVPEVETHRYPFAGEANAVVRLGFVNVAAGEPIWVDLPGLSDGYLARVWWMPDGSSFVAEILDRRQKQVQLWRISMTRDVAPTLMLEESSPTWMPVRGGLHFLKDDEGTPTGFVWLSFEEEMPRVGVYDLQGNRTAFLTDETAYVDRIVGLSGDSETVFYEGWEEDPRLRGIYKVSIDDGDRILLNPKGGTHHAVLGPAGERFVDVGSRLTSPPSVVVRDADGNALTTLHAPDKTEARSFKLEPPEPFEVETEDGTTLYGHVYLPPGHGRDQAKAWPALLLVYGGPGVQLVQDNWYATSHLQSQYMARRGYVVLRLDNRGSARRGRTFEGALYHRMGTVEVADQVLGVRELVEEWNVDPERIGIMGWSYGGYLAAMAMAKAPDSFKVGIAGAPVIDWRGYDTCYTERYMGLPAENEEGYEEGSVITHVSGIRGALMVIHGMIDENVHFRHSAILIEALIRHGKSHRLMIYPEARHGPRDSKEKAFVQREVNTFLDKALGL